MASNPEPVAFLPASHHGDWKGDNRLWVMDPDKPFRSKGTARIAADKIAYTWEHEAKGHSGEIVLIGQPAALRAEWTDSWHAKETMTFHGCLCQGRLTLYGTYPAGEGIEWGWQIEIDVQDSESLFLRMRNVMPGHEPVPAVIFHGRRA